MISGQARQNVIKSNTGRKIWRYAQADFDSASLLLSSLDLNTVLDPNNINISWNRCSVAKTTESPMAHKIIDTADAKAKLTLSEGS